MIELKNGNYTILKNIVCKLFEQRSETPLSFNEFKLLICCQESEKSNFIDFEKHPFENMYCKVFHLKEIANAFNIQTYGIYNEQIVRVFNYEPNPELVYITSLNKSNIHKNKFVDMGDHCGKDINPADLQKIWEERKQAEYNIPMPNGIELIKEIEMPKNL